MVKFIVTGAYIYEHVMTTNKVLTKCFGQDYDSVELTEGVIIS